MGINQETTETTKESPKRYWRGTGQLTNKTRRIDLIPIPHTAQAVGNPIIDPSPVTEDTLRRTEEEFRHHLLKQKSAEPEPVSDSDMQLSDEPNTGSPPPSTTGDSVST